ncbi:hypothetical protein DEIPH_ctg011orf0035 [Deinococcus phoenicis]|uniref:Uncharacterized protein n=1 Tax=Deinococcus phoenicis TaxID=1476583 RepID=A0A016QSR1_9DEIO|nr:hypothetical protein [Deinococcus phoenicis]EYB69068.1 hypothetical protein DEIPH_ctg011orf0035 [Deinococcus phoenicis]
MWTDLETVETPDLPAAKAALEAASKPAADALSKWQANQDHQDRSYVSTQVLPRSEYRLKRSKCGTKATIQRRDV